MKTNIYLTIVMLIMGSSLFGQQFVTDQNSWNVMSTLYPEGGTTEIYKMEGDTVIDSRSYVKIWASLDSLETWQPKGFLRQDSLVVWYRSPDDTTDYLLYDFNLNTGDSASIVNVFCEPGQTINVYVQSSDSVEYSGVKYKRLHLVDEMGFEDYWLNGIGSLSGPLYSMYGSLIVCPEWDLLCFHHADTLVYQNENENSCWVVGIDEYKQVEASLKPNPVEKGEPFNIETTGKINNITLYDASGRLIKTVHPVNRENALIQTTDLKRGFYLLKIATEKKRVGTCKLLVK